MRKLLMLSLVFGSLTSCRDFVTISESEYNSLRGVHTISLGKFPYNSNVDEMTVVTVDSCEYIVCNSYVNSGFTMTHKGNCKFCKKRNEQSR